MANDLVGGDTSVAVKNFKAHQCSSRLGKIGASKKTGKPRSAMGWENGWQLLTKWGSGLIRRFGATCGPGKFKQEL